MKLIHYGSSYFDPEKFISVKNRDLMTKPTGGLWASPVDAAWRWKQWCETERFELDSLSTHFIFEITDSHILKISSESDMHQNLLWIQSSFSWTVDFERLSNKYDAIFLTEKGEQETRLTFPKSLYGWDCECVLVLNKKCIILEPARKRKRVWRVQK